MIEEIKEDMVIKRKFWGNQYTSSQSLSKKSREENSRSRREVSASCSKLRNSLFFNKSYDYQKINEDYSLTERYLFANSVNILNLIVLIGQCPESNSNITSTLKIKMAKGLCYQFQISCCKCEWSELGTIQ